MAALRFDPDPAGGASERHMAAHLTAPFEAGTAATVLAIDASGEAAFQLVGATGLLLAAPLAALDRETLVVTAVGAPLPPLVFAPYTEAGAAVSWPLTSAVAAPLALSAERVEDGVASAVAPTDIAGLLELRLLEGVMGALLQLLGGEKPRIRRQARELAVMRFLGRARGAALDRLGADVSVPRFADVIAYDPVAREIVTRRRSEPDGLEPDAEYRRRVAIYRPLLVPTRRRIDALLNGSADETAPNTGPLDAIRPLPQRLHVVEDYRPFAIAVHVVAAAADPARAATLRENLLDYVRATHLVWPLNTREGNDAHSARLLPDERKAEVTALRARLRRSYAFTGAAATRPAFAPLLARALDRLARCREAIHAALPAAGALAPLELSLAQQDDGGSRYALGLGANLAPPPDLDALAGAQPDARSDDPEIQALISAMTPLPAGEDPDGLWLLEAAGLQTVHRLDATTLYVSHLPAFGLEIQGPDGDAPPTAVAAGWAMLVAGDFGGPTGHDLLVYDRLHRSGQFYSVDASGELTPLGARKTGWRGTWSIIVPGRFGAGTRDNLLFYDPGAGELAFYAYDGATDGFTPLARPTPTRTTWTHIVVAPLGATTDDLLLYDRQNGEIELHSGQYAAPDARGPAIAGVRRTWSHVAAGRFMATGDPGTQILFYDRETSVAELYGVVARSGLRFIRSYANIARGWSHVVVAPFTGGPLDDVLFYDLRGGATALARSQPDGGLDVTATVRWEPGWTHVLAGPWSDAATHDVLAFDRARNRAVFSGLSLVPAARGTVPAFSAIRAHDVTALDPATAPQPQAYTAHYNAPESDSHVVLEEGLAGTAAAWTADGHPAFTTLSKADGAGAWHAAADNDGARRAFAAAGLPDVADVAGLATGLSSVPPDLLDTIALSPELSDAILGGGGVAELQQLVMLLADNDLGSAIGFATATAAYVAVGVIGLPPVGLNLTERAPAGFSWYTVDLAGFAARLSAGAAPATALTAADDGLTALVAVGYARRGELSDPYEYRVELPAGAALDLQQYEFLMNLLDHAHPAGVAVNTRTIRERHVELDGAGVAPLPPALWSTFRPFRRARGRGADTPSSAPAVRGDVPAWSSLGGEIAGGLAALAAGDARLVVLAPSAAGDLRMLAQSGPNGVWTEWRSLGAPSGTVGLAGDLAAAVEPDGRLTVLARGGDGALWQISESAPNGGWGPWTSLGGNCDGAIALARNQDGRLQVLARGGQDLAERVQDAAGAATWGVWRPVPVAVGEAFAVAGGADGRLVVLVQAPDDSVAVSSQQAPGGGWTTPFAPLGGNAQNALAVAANHDGRLEAFAVAGSASDGALMHAWQDAPAGEWSAWQSLGGSFGVALAVAAQADGRLAALGAAPDNTLQALSQATVNGSQSWTTPTPLGGEMRGALTIAANADGRLEAFARGSHDELLHLPQSRPNGDWITT